MGRTSLLAVAGSQILMVSSCGGSNVPLPPIWSSVKLVAGERVLEPVGSGTGFRTQVEADGKLLTLTDSNILVTDGPKSWSASLPEGTRAEFEGVAGHVAYFLAKRDRRKAPENYKGPTSVWPLDLASGKWHPTIDARQLAGTKSEVIEAVAPTEDKVAVMFGTVEHNEKEYPSDRTTSHSVRVFTNSAGTLNWSVPDIKSEGDAEPSQGFLWASSYPNFGFSDVKRLTWVGEDLLICAGATEPIRLFDGETHKESWSLPRLWEFQRGFIGPSVWSHYLGRFGQDNFGSDRADPKTASAFRSLFQGRILAGPFAFGKSYLARYEVVVEVERKDAYAGYIGDCFVYDLDSRGQPFKRTPLPQIVVGSGLIQTSDGFVTPTQNRGLMRMQCPGEDDRFGGMGPGGPDATGEIVWFFQHPKVAQNHWLSTGPPYDTVAYGSGFALRANSGWYADAGDHSKITVPIDRIDLANGNTVGWKVVMTLPKPLDLPKTNYGSGPNGTYTSGAYQVGLTYIEIKRGKVRFFFATENSIEYVDFPLPPSP